MAQIAGIQFTNDALGRRRYMRIDLRKFQNNEFLEDFLDGLEAEKRKNDPTISLNEFMEKEKKRRAIK